MPSKFLEHWTLDPEVVSTGDFLGFLESHGILMLEFGPGRVRGVLHRDVDSPGMARTLQVISEYAGTGFPA